MPRGTAPTPPSSRVLAAFGAPEHPVQIPGGRGRAWRAGDLILKPADLTPDEHAWQAEVLPTIRGDGFRLAHPRRAADGALAVDGWTAWEHVAGEHRVRRWLEIIDAGAALHRATADIACPDFIGSRTDPWSVGDRVAWGEEPVEPYRGLRSVDRLVDVLRPIDAPGQLIHGDLTGNVLFADDLPPAIIDVSTYWRPRTLATAIVVADALVWEGADASLPRAFDGVGSFGQYLARALIFRLVSASIGRFEGDDAELDALYGSAVDIAVVLAPLD